jgi:hypothetical protein
MLFTWQRSKKRRKLLFVKRAGGFSFFANFGKEDWGCDLVSKIYYSVEGF